MSDNINGQLTKREYFAALAMQGMLSNPANNNPYTYGVNGTDQVGFQALGEITTAAIQYADELLTQLENTTHEQ